MGGGKYTKSVSKQVKANAKAIKKLSSEVEVKYITNIRAEAASLAGVYVKELNLSQRGTDWGQRIGQKLKMKFLETNIHFINTSGSSSRARVMILIDKYPQGLTINTNRLFNDITDNNSKIYSLRDKDFIEDYTILYDREIQFASAGVQQQDSDSEFFARLRFPVRNHVQYNDSNLGTIADVETNALYLIVVTPLNLLWYHNCILHYTDA